MPDAFSSNHDDDHGGAARQSPLGFGIGCRFGAAPSARHRHRRRAAAVAVSPAVHTRLWVGQKPRGIDQVYNHDEQWIIRKMAFEAAHDYIAELVGAKRVGKIVRLQRTNPLDPIKAELLGRLREHYAAEGAS